MGWKNKNILLVLGFVLLLIIAYQFAFSKTLAIKKEINSLETKSIAFQNVGNLFATLDYRIRYADSILGKNNLKNSSVQNNLLDFLNRQSTTNQFTISDFSEPHRFTENEVTITSYRFSIVGGFRDILEMIYKLEQEQAFGKIVHIHFEKKRDYRMGKDFLECFVVVESLVSE